MADRLELILNLEKWQVLQDALAQATGLAIITVNYKGEPVTAHSGRQPFCTRIREHDTLCALCRKCDAHGGLEAVRLSRPYVYRCHCGIIDLAIPVIQDGQYCGAIMAGQVRLDEPEIERSLEQIIRPTPEPFLKSDEMQALYEALPRLPYARFQSAIRLLSELLDYLLDEAAHRSALLTLYQSLSRTPQTSVSADSLSRLRREIDASLSMALLEPASAPAPGISKTLKPVFDYLSEHRDVMLSQADAAAMCHLSTGHFSRLFTREAGESYSGFCMRQKIGWAKELLLTTDQSVTQISDSLGFNEVSYFIKVFRRYEGITPSYFRKSAAMIRRAERAGKI